MKQSYLSRLLDFHLGPGNHPSGSSQDVHGDEGAGGSNIIRTEGASLEMGYGNMKEAFRITHPSGAYVTGYAYGQDFPNDSFSKTRAELFKIEVPKDQRRKGLGSSLAVDSLRVMVDNGALTVNMSPTNEGAKKFNLWLVDQGYISGPLRESQSGKVEYKIEIDKVMKDR